MCEVYSRNVRPSWTTIGNLARPRGEADDGDGSSGLPRCASAWAHLERVRHDLP